MGNQADLEQALNVARLYSGPNMLDNPQMEVKQRKPTSVAPMTTFTRLADRWIADNNNVGVSTLGWTTFVGFGGPPSMPAGRPRPAHINYIQMSTADAALATGDYMEYLQILEGLDLQHLKWSTPEAKAVTVSFDVYCTVADTFVLELFCTGATRTIQAPYTSTASAWKTVTITFPGDTGGTYIPSDANDALHVNFVVAAGSTFTSGPAQLAWGTTTTANRFTGVGNIFPKTINNIFAVTNVKFEVGTVATPLVIPTYAEQLRKCQRYLYAIGVQSTNTFCFLAAGMAYAATNGYFMGYFPVEMRAVPVLATSGAGTDYRTTTGTVGNGCTAVPVINGDVSKMAFTVVSTHAGALVLGQPIFLTALTAEGWLLFGAEL